MSDYFLGEIRMFGFNYAPKDWSLCNGAILPAMQYQALFSLLGTAFGGNGTQTFALPDLRSRTPLGMGAAPDGTRFGVGNTGGTETVTLASNQIAGHNHTVAVTTNAADSPAVATTTALIATAAAGSFFSPSSSLVALAPQSLTSTGGSQPHSNLQPCLAVNYCISLTGIYPARP